MRHIKAYLNPLTTINIPKPDRKKIKKKNNTLHISTTKNKISQCH